jgi:hypothetical protein
MHIEINGVPVAGILLSDQGLKVPNCLIMRQPETGEYENNYLTKLKMRS